MEGLKVRDVMTEDVIWVDKSASLEHILYLMEKTDITKIPVLDDEKLIGVVTD
ncbi:MAG: CBS domain-containing protein, partial [Thermoplasmata archaeon]